MSKPKQYCLSLDQGTFSSRATIYDDSGTVIHSAQQSIQLNRIDTQQVEQDAVEVLASVSAVLESVISSSPVDTSLIKAAGLATQRSSLLAWRPSTGVAISPVLSWQDTRAADWLANFENQTSFIQNRTGLRLSPHYGVSKMHWLLHNDKAVQQAIMNNDCVITPLASYLLFNITDNKEINIDIANASRSLLCNLSSRDWDDELLTLFGMQKNILPLCRPINYHYGTIRYSKIEMLAVNGDQTAALYSNGDPENNALTVNLGTGAFVLTTIQKEVINTTEFQQSGLLGGISSSGIDQASYYLEGTVNGAGSAIQWLKKILPDHDIGLSLQQAFNSIEPGIFINSIGGLGSPIWRSDISPCFLDELDIHKEPLKAVAAVLESIVFLLHINIQAIRSVKTDIDRVVISGGLSNNDFICQTLSNLTKFRVEKSQDVEATSRGIAWQALGQTKNWQRLTLAKSYSPEYDAALELRFERFKDYLRQIN